VCSSDLNAVRRLVFCSGKVYYDLDAGRDDANDGKVAIIRLEQFYPFPATAIRETIASYPNAREFIWAQEEPQNMGGWTFVEDRLKNLIPAGELRYIGRAASASPATGSYAIHELEQRQIVESALMKDSDEVSQASEPRLSEKVAPASS